MHLVALNYLKLLPLLAEVSLASLALSPVSAAAQSTKVNLQSLSITGVIEGVPGRGLFLVATDGCQPAATQKKDVIDCTGIVSGSVQGKGGNDTITVVSGAVLTPATSSSQTGIAGDKGSDTLVNDGDIVLVSGGKTATATGIAGAGGDDNIQNHSSVNTTATADNGRGGIIVFRKDAATHAGGTATGVDGGAGDDQITNTGTITVTADARASSIDSSIDINFRALDASINAVATATGVKGGKGEDDVTTGALVVTANAEASSSNSSFQPIDLRLRFNDLNASTNATAVGLGIEGGELGGEITHKDSSTITAEARASATDVNISFANINAATGSLDASINATANATGIASGNALKTTLEGGSMNVAAVATAFTGGFKATGADLLEQSTAAIANATAIGVTGGNPEVSITNAGDLTVNSSAAATTLSGEFSYFDRAQGDATTSSVARATGIQAEQGSPTIVNGDEITKAGSLNVTATATSTALGVVAGIKAPPRLIGGPESKFTAAAESTAVGVASGKGDDTITNFAVTQVTATATGVSGNFTFEKDGAADVEAVAAVHATAIGIASGAGNDTITNDSTVTVKAEGTSHAVDLAYGQADDLIPIPSIPELIKGKPPETDAGRIATARSTGIDSGAGDDGVTNRAAIAADATSLATSTAVSVSIETEDDDDDDKKGKKPSKVKKVIGFVTKNILDLDFLNDALIDTSVRSEASSTGIAAGDGQNTVTIDASVKGSATATTVSTSALLDFTIAKKEDAKGKWFIFKPGVAKSQATATANVTGISSGSGNDTITNNNEIDFTATAGANSLSVTAINQPKLSGVGLTSAMSDTSTITSAAATGITSGGGNDTITNNVGGTVSAKSASHAFADSVAVNVEAEGKGLEIGAALTNSKTTSDATAVGIDAGTGADHVTNAGTLTAEAVGRGNSLSASVSVQGALDGVGIHAALSNSSTNTTATASGIQTTGSIADTLDNPGSMTVKADAGASAESGSVGVQLGGNGLEIAAALTRADTSATADAVGIESTGNGSRVTSGTMGTGTGTLAVDAIAKSNSLGISVSVQKDVNGVGIAGALADTTTHTDAIAVGIKNSGLKGEQISNYGALTARADSRAFAESVGVNVQTGGGGISAGAALTLSGTRAVATATGIVAGMASQSVVNDGDVTGEAAAVGNSVGISFGFRGENTGSVSLSAALSDAKTEGFANGTGISSQGPIAEDFSNTGNITGKADAQGYSESASITIQAGGTGLEVGAALARSGTSADATARGIDFAGGNKIDNSGLIKADADATTDSLSLSLAGQGSVKGLGLQGALTDTATTATAHATAASLIGGDNTYTQLAGGETVAEADSSAAAQSIAATFSGFSSVGGSIGVALARSGVQSNANAVGIASEAGGDTVTNAGTVTATSNAIATALGVSVGFGLTEAQFAAQGAAVDASSHSEAIATGVTSGAGADTIQNDNAINVAATATTGATTVGATVVATTNGVAVGAALVRGTTEAHAESVAIDAGIDNDRVTNNKTISASATAQSTATGISAGLTTLQSGAAFAGTGADTSAKASAQAIGLDGGFGDDKLKNFDSVTALANSSAGSTTVSVTVSAAMTGLTAGAALGRSTTDAESYSAGMEGNAGNDTIINRASVVSTATASTDSVGALVGIGFTNSGVALSGTGGDTSLNSIATANGLSGGTGADLLRNKGSIAATSTSNVDADTFAVNVSGTGTGLSVGGALTRSKSEGNALSTGIAGGDDNDRLVNKGTVSSSATSIVNTRDVSIGLGVTGTGVAVEATAVDASATSLANAAGMSGDTEADVIHNKGAIDAVSNAQITTKGYSVSASGTVTGVGAGVALSRATTTAVANSMAIAGDHFQIGIGDDGQVVEAFTARDGADSIENRHAVTATATANADADSTSVSLGLTGTGLQVGGALADLRNNAVARATGISGGAGQDGIDNYNSITASSDATASGTSVSVALQGNLAGVAIGVALTNATTEANATTTGISGDDGDDNIYNEGALGSSAKAQATATSVAVSAPLAIVPLGAALADSSATANAHAYGIVGGAGNDVIDNWGAIAIGTVGAQEGGADARATGGAVAASVIGASIGNANAIAEANAIGIDGGAGADTIDNNSTVTATARSAATGTAVTINLVAGASIGDARAEATANAVAIRAGSENDTVTNLGNLTSDANSEARGTSVNITLAGAGASVGKVGSEAHATSIGIDGGAGDDSIESHGSVVLSAVASAPSASVNLNIQVAGAAVGNADTSAEATTKGISGDEGRDTITSYSNMTGVSDAKTGTTGVSVNLIGAASANANITATALGSGIDGGEGNDTLKNFGTIDWTATSDASATSVSINLIGAALGGATTLSTATATGIGGGDGNDGIDNQGKITLIANATTQSGGVEVSLAGDAEANSNIQAIANATGIDGGKGDDTVLNSSTIEVTSTASASVHNVTVEIAGLASSSKDVLTATTNASGILGNEGNDSISSTGDVTVTATSTTTISGSTVNIFGASQSAGTANTHVTSIGLDGGEGDDVIDNFAKITASSNGTMTINGGTFEFGGVASATGSLISNTSATGVAGGAGSDSVKSQGAIEVTSSATLTATGNTKAIFGSANADAALNANATAVGIDGGAGADTLENGALLKVTSSATMTSTRPSLTVAGSSSADALLEATSQATGIGGGDDDDSIYNSATIEVTATSAQTAMGGSKAVLAGGGTASASSTATANAIGVDAGAGNNFITNDGVLNVQANPSGTVTNTSDAGFLFGTSGARSDLNFLSTSHGIRFDNDNNTVINNGAIKVDADSSGTATATAVGATLANGDAAGTAFAKVDGAAFDLNAGGVASGIKGGDGNNVITNNSSITVAAKPQITARASVNGNGIDGDGTGTATATVKAEAAGIYLGDGANQIFNNGVLNVTAKPKATANASVDSDVGGTARATATASTTAQAIGVHAGNGGNSIVNAGQIIVTAEPTSEANAQASADSISVCIPFTRICAEITVGSAISKTQSPESGTAIGIDTGSGNDAIVNNGTITVTETVEDVTSNGVAIRTGAGNDTVVLGNGSVTTGSIELGDGDDILHLVGTPTVNGNIDSGSGANSLVFDGNGSFSNPLSGFVNALKQGAGTFTLPSLPTMTGKLEVKEGTLQVNSNYQMAASSTFQTTVNADGSHGQLKVGGTAGLDGALVVDKGPGTYVNGTTYDVVSANSVTGGFDSQQLPAPTALVSFRTNQTSMAFQVQANVAALATVARNGVGASLAKYLDQAAPAANGDLARVLGDFQQLSQRDFNRGFSSLSQESYHPFNAATLSTLERYNGAIHTRMNIARASFRGIPLAEAIDRTDLAQEAYLAQFGSTPLTLDLFDRSNFQEARRRPGFWLSGFGNTRAQNDGGGFSGFNYRTQGIPVGFDFRLSDQLIAGVAATQSHGVLTFQDEQSKGSSEGAFATLYGTYFTANAELEGMFSYGRDSYSNARRIALGGLDRHASSEHESDVFAARLEGRYHFNIDAFRIEPFASMQYSRLNADGFRERGASALDLIVDQRSVDVLVSQVGFRFLSPMALRAGTLIPELTAAWQHDFHLGSNSIAASLRGAPQERFRIGAPNDSGSALKLGGALTFIGNQNFSAAAGVNAVVGKSNPEAAGLLQLQFRW